MPGLRAYRNILAIAGQDGDRQLINARGTTVFIRAANGPLTVETRSSAIGDEPGETYSVTMAASEKLFTAAEFDTVEITNQATVANTVEIYLGFGDFFRPVPDIVNFAQSVPSSRNIITFVDRINIDVGNAGQESIAPIMLTRTRMILTASASNTDRVRVGDTNIDIDRGLILRPGESVVIDSTDEVFACSEAVVNQVLAVYIETL